ncbi:MAG: hypothetical protein GY898_32310 [Proteobacteria bacterium]|nr:hypothetical protein [Pseudomonadota bacterium]
MSETTRLTDLIAALQRDLDNADPRVRPRKEFKNAEAWVRELDPEAVGEDGLEDAIRDGEAMRDLLDLAITETQSRVDAEERTKQTRLREDEELLTMIGNELKLYGGLIFASFVLPPATLGPFGAYCGFGVIPAAFGLARMISATAKVDGRSWLILQDRVDQLMSKVKMAHGAAAGAGLLTILWVVIALLAGEAGGG